MDESPSIPVMKKPANMMVVGPNGNNLAVAAATRHPVDYLQQTLQNNPHRDLEFVRHVYGSGLAMRLATEQKIAMEQERDARAVGLPTSNLYQEIVTGQDTKLDFGDFLSLPEYRPDLPRENLHAVMEQQLGM